MLQSRPRFLMALCLVVGLLAATVNYQFYLGQFYEIGPQPILNFYLKYFFSFLKSQLFLYSFLKNV